MRKFQYRRTGFKCVTKCLRLRENKLIAFPIIAIANDLSHTHAHPVHVVPGSVRKDMASIDTGVCMFESVVRGHHIYKRIWTLHEGEQLLLKCEEDNDHDL